MEEVPKKIEHQLAQYQELQRQAQIMIAQRQQLELQMRESERAIEELDKLSDDKPIYKSIGSLLIRVKSREGIIKELKEEKETAEVRAKTLDRQIERLRERLNTLQKDISEQLKVREELE
ncbi:MAG: prefoldin subunit beta [Candidatus Thermoplasmatota archaeon]|nr:prefoldin subunit beta [Candidatus Thermoplasmatota archaeon]